MCWCLVDYNGYTTDQKRKNWNLVSDAVRLSAPNRHVPEMGTYRRCALCSTRAKPKRCRLFCRVCNVALHQQCFAAFHTWSPSCWQPWMTFYLASKFCVYFTTLLSLSLMCPDSLMSSLTLYDSFNSLHWEIITVFYLLEFYSLILRSYN